MRDILLTEADGTFIASVPSLPKVRAEGDTLDLALLHIKIAVEQRLVELSRNNEIAPDTEPIRLEFVASLSESLSDERYRVFVAERQQLTRSDEQWAINKLHELIDEGQLPASALHPSPKVVEK